MTIPAYVMAVPFIPERARTAAKLRREEGATIIWDSTQNAMDTFRDLLMQAVDDGDRGFIILQDDIILADDWRQKVEYAIAERPSAVINFFSMKKDDDVSGWRPGTSFISNLCVYIPAGYAAELLVFSHQFVQKYPKFKTADDFVIRYFLRDQREQFWMYCPSLVQHAKMKSAINERRPGGRVSHTFEGAAS